MARDMFKFVNTVGWKNDIESFRRLKKEVRGFKKEIDSMYKGVNKSIPKSPFSDGGGRGGGYSKGNRHLVDKEIDRRFKKEVKREEDLYKLRQSKNNELQAQENLKIRSAVSGLTSSGSGLKAKDSALADMLRKEESQNRFVEKQDQMIENFLLSNRQIRQLDDGEKDILKTRLRSKKTLEETRTEMRKIRTTLQDTIADQKKNTREMEKQNALTKRMNASYLQLGTSIASAYTALAAGQQIVQTGIAIEGINKTLLSVTGSTQAAAEEFKFLEQESLRLGLSLQEGGKAYAKLLAAGKGKLELQDIRDTFTAVSEAGTVLGLSQDDMAGSIRAIQQILSKGKVTAEELSGQLAERIPTALSAMARATKDAGLTMNGTEQEMFKLMEQGKLLAKDVMPAFAKQLRQTAHDGGALTHALDNNLSVAIGKATFNLQQMSNAIFTGGLKDALKLVLDNFNLLAPKTKDLAFLLGKTLGGAVTAVTMPFVLFGAALADVWTLTKKLTGVNDEMGKSLLALVAKVAGLVLGFKALFSVMKKVAKMAGFIKDTAKVAGTAGATASAGATATGGTLASVGARIAAGASPIGAMLALGSTKQYDANNPMFTPMNFNMPKRENPYNSSFQPRDVNVKVKVDIDEQGNWKGAVQNIADNAVMDAEDQRVQQALNSFHGGGY